MITKKELAQRRNWFKFRLNGAYLIPPKQNHILTNREELLIQELEALRQTLIKEFDDNSRKLGLKVPKNRCWCRKEGKYKPEYEVFHESGLVCKKHIKEE